MRTYHSFTIEDFAKPGEPERKFPTGLKTYESSEHQKDAIRLARLQGQEAYYLDIVDGRPVLGRVTKEEEGGIELA